MYQALLDKILSTITCESRVQNISRDSKVQSERKETEHFHYFFRHVHVCYNMICTCAFKTYIQFVYSCHYYSSNTSQLIWGIHDFYDKSYIYVFLLI